MITKNARFSLGVDVILEPNSCRIIRLLIDKYYRTEGLSETGVPFERPRPREPSQWSQMKLVRSTFQDPNTLRQLLSEIAKNCRPFDIHMKKPYTIPRHRTVGLASSPGKITVIHEALKNELESAIGASVLKLEELDKGDEAAMISSKILTRNEIRPRVIIAHHVEPEDCGDIVKEITEMAGEDGTVCTLRAIGLRLVQFTWYSNSRSRTEEGFEDFLFVDTPEEVQHNSSMAKMSRNSKG